MEWLFVLKDKGTKNAGWWLKISSPEELLEYLKATNNKRYGDALENYRFGKEYGARTLQHGPHINAEPLTQAITMHATNMNAKYGTKMNIIEAIMSFSNMVAARQLDEIINTGAIYINRVGGYHSFYDISEENGFTRRKKLIWPTFKKDEIRIKSFPGGQHFYAYIDDTQVRDGDVLKWNTYEEAYNQALAYIE